MYFSAITIYFPISKSYHKSVFYIDVFLIHISWPNNFDASIPQTLNWIVLLQKQGEEECLTWMVVEFLYFMKDISWTVGEGDGLCYLDKLGGRTLARQGEHPWDNFSWHRNKLLFSKSHPILHFVSALPSRRASKQRYFTRWKLCLIFCPCIETCFKIELLLTSCAWRN